VLYLDAGELFTQGLPVDAVERVIRMVDAAEYKRRQAPPGIRISTKAFGRDRRLPITNRYVSRVPPEAGGRRRLRALR
jgi:NAD+ synthase (glutamine-hydrolysing)